MSTLPFTLIEDEPLARHTTLAVGGPARYLARCGDVAALEAALGLAERDGLPLFVLGGGSNLLVADDGFDGLVVRLEDATVELEDDGDATRVRAAAGVEWDRLVALAVDRGLGGLECLSGIPGLTGAAPIQNVGAYGQEVAETLVAVETLERATGARRTLAAADCGFGYRQSRFKGDWRGRHVVTAVHVRLPRGVPGVVRYGDLERRFAGRSEPPTPADVRCAVLEVRRAKSMVIDPGDPNRRSAGSFFMNPVVTPDVAAAVREAALRLGVERPMPAFPTPEGRVKLAAAWLIEAAGFRRGHRHGRTGLSTNHALAIVNRGGARAADLVALAREIRLRVRDRFAVTLVPEPVFLGFPEDVDTLLG